MARIDNLIFRSKIWIIVVAAVMLIGGGVLITLGSTQPDPRRDALSLPPRALSRLCATWRRKSGGDDGSLFGHLLGLSRELGSTPP